ncbi:Imidazolonepropionase [hydrothermal vent metagenome]|uniref:imidazolonepropionase n=1 Tax=hydrothermal vent metagenome TaxID=652676 RepID=A0A3B0RTS7_9ZZZZ
MTPWDSLWQGGRIMPLHDPDNPAEIITDGAIAVTEGRIAWLGPMGEIDQSRISPETEIHHARGKLITPGLLDCHTHLVFGGNRADEFEQRLSGASYAEIARAGGGIKSTVAATRKASERDLYLSAHDRAWHLINSGVTTMEIKSGYGLDLETERKMLRVAAKLADNLPITIRTTYLAAHALPDAYVYDTAGYIDHVIDHILPEIARENLAHAVDGFCETIAFQPGDIDRLFTAAKKLGFEVKLHAEQLSNSGGAMVAAKHAALSADHLEYAGVETIRQMAVAGTVAVLLPGAFYYLNESQKPPIALFREHGVPMAVATDCNPGSAPLLSLTAALNMACILYGMTPLEALTGATLNGAKALGLSHTKGSLAVGKDADFILWNADHPTEICYWGGTSLAKNVVHQGQVIAPLTAEYPPDNL